MSQALMQYSFHAGELAPALNARVDISKYKSGAALMRNFYPDYRGGASSRPGTRYVLRCKSLGARLIPFQAATSGNNNFVIEAGDHYFRFFNRGFPVLEAGITITSISQANPAVVTTSTNHNLGIGDWVFISGTSNSKINGRYFIVGSVPTGTTFTITDLWGTNIDATAYGAMTGGTVQRVYTLVTPYAIADVQLLKFSQNTNTLLITHTNYTPTLLQELGVSNWLLAPVVIGSTISPPTMGAPSSTLAAGTVNYAYVVTSVDSGGQESPQSTVVQLNSLQDIRSVAGTNVINWSAQPGAVSYNVYRAEPSYAGAVPTGAAFGFVGNSTGTSFVDSNIAPDFSQSVPTVQNPFQGQSVVSYTVTANGSYTTAPTVNVGTPAAGGQQATAEALIGLLSTTTATNTVSYAVGTVITLCGASDPNKTPVGQLRVTTGAPGFVVIPSVLFGPGQTPPTGAASLIDANGGPATATPAYGVLAIAPLSIGSCYNSAPSVTITPGAATATSTLSTGASTSNPGCSTYFQQRLVMAAPVSNPQEFNMSQTGSYFNFNIANPVGASDAIQGSLVSFQINNIKSLAPMSTGLLVFSDRAAWLINGGSIGSPVSPSQIVATQHSYIGANDMPPIVINFDVLYVQAKGSIVRDLTYNFYAQIYTGTDISILSSHLFYGFKLNQWAYAEEPFKLIWLTRSDGVLLSLTYLKEQEIIGWSHHDTPGASGTFQSVCAITEAVPFFTNFLSQTTNIMNVDALYVITQRTINSQTVQYVERFAERLFTSPQQVTPTVNLSWCVDCGVQSSSNTTPAPSQTVILDHLKGLTVTGIADGTAFTAAVAGNPPSITQTANIITVGLTFTPQLQTLQLDTGEPTSQGKRKKIPAVTVRVQDTLGLSIGKTFNSLVPMKDLIKGGLNIPSNTVVNDLFTGDARTILDPSWDVPGQYCIQQSNPWPATILGVIPEIVVGDTPPSNK